MTATASIVRPFSWRFTAPLFLGSALNPVNSALSATALLPIAAGLRVATAIAQLTAFNRLLTPPGPPPFPDYSRNWSLSMPITTLDPGTALLVVDVQAGLRQSPKLHPLGEIAERAGELAAAFRQRSLPVVLINVVGGAPGGPIGRAHRTARFPTALRTSCPSCGRTRTWSSRNDESAPFEVAARIPLQRSILKPGSDAAAAEGPVRRSGAGALRRQRSPPRRGRPAAPCRRAHRGGCRRR